METKEFDLHALVLFLEQPQGRTLADIACTFGVTVRTVQRRLQKLRNSFPGIDIRESTEFGVKTFRCMRRRAPLGAGIARSDVLALHRLRMAVLVFRAGGLYDDANFVSSLVEAQLASMPRAKRNLIERQLKRLAEHESVATAPREPVCRAGIAGDLRLAIFEERKVRLRLACGEVLCGAVLRLSHGLDGSALVSLALEDGQRRAIELRNVHHVEGVEDLAHEDLRAA
jgi:hypothetical protein